MAVPYPGKHWGRLKICIPPPTDDVTHEQLQRLVRVRRVIGGSDVEKGDWPFLTHMRGKVSYGWWGMRTKVFIDILLHRFVCFSACIFEFM